MRARASVALLFLFPVVGASESGIAGPLEEGLAAYDNYNYCAALKTLQPLAEQGNVEAQIRLGLIYRDGSCTRSDSAKAMKWLRLAADQDNAEAQFALGKLYADCWGVKTNYSEMLKLHLRAAEQGYVHAQDHLGYLYAFGVGVPVDNFEAYFWYDRAAAQGGASDAAKRDLIAKKLTPEQLVEAQQRGQEWKPK